MKIFSTFSIAIATLLIVGACAQSLAPRPMPHFAFDQTPPIKLDVNQILFHNQYDPDKKANAVDPYFPMTLSQSVGHWVGKRLVASGDTGGTVTLTITEASVVKSSLPVTQGVKGWFTVDQSEKFNAKIAVTVEATGTPFGNQSGQINVTRGITVPEDATLAQRERIWVKLTEAIMADFDAAADRFFVANMPGAIIP